MCLRDNRHTKTTKDTNINSTAINIRSSNNLSTITSSHSNMVGTNNNTINHNNTQETPTITNNNKVTLSNSRLISSSTQIMVRERNPTLKFLKIILIYFK
jgi:hypothetical protein